jgi:tripartite-type tricarboxylate transporter receptor subunit TctC
MPATDQAPVPISAVALSSLLPVVDSGKVKLLAITSDKRSSLTPDVPTVNETGVLKDFQSSIWTALFAPVGTPADIVSKIEAYVIDVLKDPALVDRLQKVGAEVSGGPATRLRVHIQR